MTYAFDKDVRGLAQAFGRDMGAANTRITSLDAHPSYAAARDAVKPADLRSVAAIVGEFRAVWRPDPTGTCLGGGWSPAGPATPEHWGAQPFIVADQSAAVQAAIDFARNSWHPSSWSFERVVDFGGGTFVCDQPIDCTGLRQPRLTIRNGAILSRASGKIAFDAALSNGIIFDDFVVYGDADQPPAWGIYVGRALLNGAYPGVDGVAFTGRSGCWGYFSRGGLLSFAAEVNAWTGRTFFHNRHRGLSAVSVACVDSMGAIVRHFGSETASDFQTLPTAATGNHSNVCHDWGQAEIRRVADYNLTVTGISNAAQAVITVAAGTLDSANISVGDQVYVTGGGMPGMSYRPHTVISVAGDAITTSTDSTGMGGFVGGAQLQNRTGSALLSSGMRTVTMSGSYILTYGAPCILIDGEGGAPYDWHVQVQFERHTDKPVTIKRASGTMVIPQFHLSVTNTSQNPETAIMWIEGAGSIRLDGGSLRLSNMATAPSQSVLGPVAQWSARGFDIDVPLQAALPDPAQMILYSGRTVAQDRVPPVVYHGGRLNALTEVGFGTSTQPLTGPGLRWTDGGLSAFRPEISTERRLQLQDVATTAQLSSASDRVNTVDKWQGKAVWNASLSRPVYAVGALPASGWVFGDGSAAHTPI